MDQNKLYSKSELFRAPYSKLKKYVRGHGLPIERGVTRAKLAKQLIAVGIYRKPQTKENKNSRRNSLRSRAPTQKVKSQRPKAQSPTYLRKSKQSYEVTEKDYLFSTVTPHLRTVTKPNDIPGTPPPALVQTSSIRSNQSTGGSTFPGSPETNDTLRFSVSMTPDSEFSTFSSNSFSRAGSNRSIGTGKRTPEFSGADSDAHLPSSKTVLKRDPSNGSRSGSENQVIQPKKACVDIKHSTGEHFPNRQNTRDRSDSGRGDKQRDSITKKSQNTKRTLKGTKKPLRNTKKGRRRRKKKATENKKKRRLADMRSETGERSSQEIFGTDVDGWPEIPPRAVGERNTIHADPTTPPAKRNNRLPDDGGFRELRAQFTEDLKGHDLNLESMKMYWLPVLNTNMKRLLSDEESLLLQDLASTSEKHSDLDDSVANFLLEELLPDSAHFDTNFDECPPQSTISITSENQETTFDFKSYSSSESLDDVQPKRQKLLIRGQNRRKQVTDNHGFLSPSMNMSGMASSAGGLRSASMLDFGDIIALADEELRQEADNSEEEDTPPFADEVTIPRRQRMSLRDLRNKEREVQDAKQELIDNVAYDWQAKSSVDGFYFDEGDRVIYQDRNAWVVTRTKTDAVFYVITMDDSGEEITVPESELVYAMILQIRRRTLSSKMSHSSAHSNSSSMYYQTCTDKIGLSPRGGSTFHSFRSMASERSMA